MSLSQWVWAPSPKSHLNPQLMGETWSKEFAPQQMAGTHHSWVGWCGEMLGGKTITLLDDLNIMPTLVLEFPTFRLRAPSAHHSAPVTTHTHTHTHTRTHMHSSQPSNWDLHHWRADISLSQPAV